MARRKHHYYVYVVALDDTVWNEARFRRANPDYRFDKPCVYVGMTGLDPDLRFDRHKAGIQANRYVRDSGLRLMPELYEVYNPMPYRGAQVFPALLAGDVQVYCGPLLSSIGYVRAGTLRALAVLRLAEFRPELGREAIDCASGSVTR